MGLAGGGRGGVTVYSFDLCFFNFTFESLGTPIRDSGKGSPRLLVGGLVPGWGGGRPRPILRGGGT